MRVMHDALFQHMSGQSPDDKTGKDEKRQGKENCRKNRIGLDPAAEEEWGDQRSNAHAKFQHDSRC